MIYRIRRSCILLALVFFCSLMFAHPHHVYAVGEGNIDSGGGGMGREAVKTYGPQEMMVCA